MEDYLDNCLNSLIISDKDLFERIEILVVNDGSKDGSSIIAHDFEKRYPNTFFVINKENGNYGSCINSGLGRAKGKYIKILDADDSFDTNNFEEFLNILLHIDVDMVISDYCIIDDSNCLRNVESFNVPHNRVISPESLLNGSLSIQMHAVTYKTDNLKKLNYVQSEGVSYTDQEWMFIPITMVETVYYFNKIVYKYLIGREGQTVDDSIYHKKVNDRIIGAQKMILDLHDYKYDSKYTKYLKERLYSRVKYIYFSCIIINREDTLLVDFDNFVHREAIDLYQSLDKEKYLGLLFVNKWRNEHHFPPLWFRYLINIQGKYANFKFFLKKYSFFRKLALKTRNLRIR